MSAWDWQATKLFLFSYTLPTRSFISLYAIEKGHFFYNNLSVFKVPLDRKLLYISTFQYHWIHVITFTYARKILYKQSYISYPLCFSIKLSFLSLQTMGHHQRCTCTIAAVLLALRQLHFLSNDAFSYYSTASQCVGLSAQSELILPVGLFGDRKMLLA